MMYKGDFASCPGNEKWTELIFLVEYFPCAVV